MAHGRNDALVGRRFVGCWSSFDDVAAAAAVAGGASDGRLAGVDLGSAETLARPPNFLGAAEADLARP